MPEVRMPTQKRSIEKRNIIIEKGFELMCEEGYYNTNTTQIAKYAGVSTGIIYQYFNDKKDIFIEGVKNYSEKIMFPLVNIFEKSAIKNDTLPELLRDVIKQFIKTHTISKKAHEELIAMSHLDDDIAEIFKKSELKTTEKLVSLLKENGFEDNNLNEKVHICINLIDNYCHEMVYHKHESMNYKAMEDLIIKLIIDTIKM